MLSEHTKNGVKVHAKAQLKEIKGDHGAAKSIVLSTGTEIPVDLVLLGTGIDPATDFLKGSGVELDARGGVITDPFL